MPAIKGGRRVGQKKEDIVEDAIVPEKDDISEEDAPTTKPKGRAVVKKGKAGDSKKDDDIEDIEDDSAKNSEGKEDAIGEKSGPKSRGKGAAKKSSAKESDDSEEQTKKAAKRGNSKDEASGENEGSVKPKKVGKKEEVLPTRRGGDRAAKKPVSYESEEKVPAAKKGRGTKAKNGVPKVAAKEKRGRGAKKVDVAESDDEMETAEDSGVDAATVSVEHCKS